MPTSYSNKYTSRSTSYSEKYVSRLTTIYLNKEDADFLLLESGDQILLSTGIDYASKYTPR